MGSGNTPITGKEAHGCGILPKTQRVTAAVSNTRRSHRGKSTTTPSDSRPVSTFTTVARFQGSDVSLNDSGCSLMSSPGYTSGSS